MENMTISAILYNFLFGLAAYIIIEIIGLFIFKRLRNYWHINTEEELKKNQYKRFSPVFMGRIERAFLLIAMLAKVPFIIPVFITMKVATLLTEEEKKKPNDYFFVGNLISITLVLIAVILVEIGNKLI